MFQKLVAIEPLGLIPSAVEKLSGYAKEVVLYDDIPDSDEQIVRRIGDADAVLLSYTSHIPKVVIDACPRIRYIGMCCSLYSPESANVDILAAGEKGIAVTGVRDYGDQGVVEYVISELVRYLHGFGGKQWKAVPTELTNLKVGVIGLGTTGRMIAEALQALGADLYYFSRTRKAEQEARGIQYRPLDELLPTVDVACTCLNKNAIVLYEEQFAQFGNRKILFNTSIGPSHDMDALVKWLEHGGNEFFCDSAGALGDDRLLAHPHVNCLNVSSGRTEQAFAILSEKVLANLEGYLSNR